MTAFIKTVQTALKALTRNVTRSALTCVGIIIGIAAVIAMMEIGKGVSALNERSIASLGANNLMIQSGAAQSGGVSWGSGSVITLTADDCDAIIKDCPAVRAAAPTIRGSGQVSYLNKNIQPPEIVGTTPAYLDVREWPVELGAMFTDQDVVSQNRVCLIGQTTRDSLFATADPLGKEIRIGNVSMRVIGVLARKGANMFGRDQDDVILAPWKTVKKVLSSGSSSSSGSSGASGSGGSSSLNSLENLYPTSPPSLYPQQSDSEAQNNPRLIRFANISTIMAAANSSPEISAAMKQITDLLRERHRLSMAEADDFTIRDMTELMETIGKQSELMSKLLLIVATISLAVGGVGIMNIMLVSVTERTREIGLRMAVGARARDILTQFLIEAIVLCLAGGLVGIGLGRGASLTVRALMNWPTAISIPAIVGSVIVSATVGIVFGFYPAWKASRLDPIDALRYE